ncbi:MAG: TetR/AcrR family transcriptional regulator [Pirellulales bacterium]
MARYQSDHKQQTRERLVASAVRTFRRAGVENAGLNEIMQELGLTVGGFYRHFDSKSELVQAAVARGLEQSLERMRHAPSDDPLDGMQRFAEIYLSEAHRRALADGCVLAALGSDIARGDSQTKAVCEQGLRAVHTELNKRLPSDAGPLADRLWGLIALEVGGLLLARMVDRDDTAAEILASCRQATQQLLGRPVKSTRRRKSTSGKKPAQPRRRSTASKRVPA